MTPKEKALTLCQSFGQTSLNDEEFNEGFTLPKHIAKKCAIIAVNEIINIFQKMHKPEYASFDCIGGRELTFQSEFPYCLNGYEMIAYYEQVKTEIEKL